MLTTRTPQKVRFIIAWQTYRVGDIIEPNGTLRQWLLGNGFVELVAAETNTVKVPMIKRVKATANRVMRKGAR